MKSLIGFTPLLAPLAPVALLVGALWGGARMPSPDELQAFEPRFATTDASVLFFRNIRSVQYDKRDGPAEGIDLYSLRGLDDAPLRPFIVHRWLADRAYIMFESNIGPDAVRVDGEDFELARERPEEAFQTAMRMCAAFQQGATVQSLDGTSLFANRRHSKLFERLCRDYLELVDLY